MKKTLFIVACVIGMVACSSENKEACEGVGCDSTAVVVDSVVTLDTTVVVIDSVSTDSVSTDSVK